ncbi:AAA family ATPase [Blastococcus sp. CT_GayMR16]|uniref:AAA family ATPase n=1 Tax=Blastococcus sp. CT_GayMR16 TaxID=2559607 RepID=UPI001ADDCA75|nr:AAA family ATPase [Blastococcus sp. CT_GayMR16]
MAEAAADASSVPQVWSRPIEPADRLPSTFGMRIDIDGRTGRLMVRDANGAEWEPDRRTELAIPGHVEAAEARHAAGRHADATEHGCPSCWVRQERHRNPAGSVGLSDGILMAAGGMDTVRARWRAHLLSSRRVAEEREIRAPREVSVDGPAYSRLDELAALVGAPMLVEDVLPAGELAWLVARGGVGKTTHVVELIWSVLTGQPFHGRAVDSDGRALLVATEGTNHLPAQFAAVEAHHDRPLTPAERADLTIRTQPVDLFGGGPELEELIERCRRTLPDLVVIDTFQRCAGRADQNSASDLSRITGNLDRIKRASGGTVLVVAHAGKSSQEARGSSAMQDDARAVWTLKRDGDRVTWGFPKVYNRPDGFTETLYPRTVAGALVLADQPDPARAIAWTSNSSEAKVVGALRQLAPLGPQSQSAIVRQTEPLAQSAVSAALARLVKEGAVHRTGAPGRGAAYRLADEDPR